VSTHRRQIPSGHRREGRPTAHRLLPVALCLGLLGIGGAVGPSVVETISGGTDQRRIALASLPADTPDQGLIYEGLRPARASSICAGAYQIDEQSCTHGPDAPPAGLSVRRGVAPVTAKAPEPVQPTRETPAVPTDAEIARDEGGSALTADAPALVPDPAPGEASFIMGAHDVACEGDGRGGKRVQVLYLHEFGTPSRYSDFVGSIRNWAAGVDEIFDESAGETGGSRHVRFVTTPQCRVEVSEVQLPADGLRSFTASIDALSKLGYNRADRKYLMFADATVYCGIATYIADDRAGLGNRNNGGPSYGRVDSGCWSATMAAHELTHTLGAVLDEAPNANGIGGCLDEFDLLCGADQSGKKVRNVCPKRNENRLDCGHDDYFSTNPKPGSYLATHWNIAQSEFLLRSDGGDDVPDSIGAQALPAAPGTTPAKPAPSVSTPPTPAGPDPGAADGGGDAPPTGGLPSGLPGLPSGLPELPDEQPTGLPIEPIAATGQPQAVPAGTGNQPDPVQAVLETRDATSGSVRLTWSSASPTATYEVSVDGKPIATTKATRARLIGLKPDAKYQVTIKSGSQYTARATAETAPAARPAQNSWFILTNGLTGGAANLYAARSTDGTPLTLSGADGGAQQQWQLVPVGDNNYSLVSRATGKCVIPLDGNPAVGAPLVQGDCGTYDAARWALQASPYGFILRTTVGDLVAGVGDQRYGAYRVLVLQKATGQRHQSWTAVPD
jgi:hypothetical protein